MVTAQLYLTRFFNVMPRRFELIKELKDAKAKLDKSALDDSRLSNNEISQLISIIGKDTFFRKAEIRNKPTLRHIAWKLKKSMENFGEFKRVWGENKIPKKFKKKVLYLREFLAGRLPYITELVKQIDSVYRREVSVLQAILIDKGNITAYKQLLEEEKRIVMNTEPHFIIIKDRTITLVNVLREYEEYLKREDKDLPEELKYLFGHFLLSCVFILVGLTGVFSLFHPTTRIDTMWTLITGGIGFGSLALWGFNVDRKLRKLTETMI